MPASTASCGRSVWLLSAACVNPPTAAQALAFFAGSSYGWQASLRCPRAGRSLGRQADAHLTVARIWERLDLPFLPLWLRALSSSASILRRFHWPQSLCSPWRPVVSCRHTIHNKRANALGAGFSRRCRSGLCDTAIRKGRSRPARRSSYGGDRPSAMDLGRRPCWHPCAFAQ